MKVIRGKIYRDKYSGEYIIPLRCNGWCWFGKRIGYPIDMYLGRKSRFEKLSKEEIKKIKLENL